MLQTQAIDILKTFRTSKRAGEAWSDWRDRVFPDLEKTVADAIGAPLSKQAPNRSPNKISKGEDVISDSGRVMSTREWNNSWLLIALSGIVIIVGAIVGLKLLGR
jgi:hypothetical protein